MTTRMRNSGLGAASVPFTGTKIVFDSKTNYPLHTKEYLYSKINELEARNQFLEDIIYRATMEQPIERDYEYINIRDYVYCWHEKKYDIFFSRQFVHQMDTKIVHHPWMNEQDFFPIVYIPKKYIFL